MYVALNELGERTHIRRAVKGDFYFCPLCKKQLVTRLNSKKKSPHFAHQRMNGKKDADYTPCVDLWDYDETKWRSDWLEAFPAEYVEVAVDSNTEKHLADVYINNTAILFFDSNSSYNRIMQRIHFFKSAHIPLIFVFNFTREAKFDKLTLSKDNDKQHTWKSPTVLFRRLKLENSDYQIYWQLTDNKDKTALYRVFMQSDNFSKVYLDNEKQYSIQSFIDTAVNNINEINCAVENGKPLLELWTENTKWMIVKNLDTGKIYQLTYDPRRDIETKDCVLGNQWNGKYDFTKGAKYYLFYENQVKLHNWHCKQWEVVKSTNKDK